MIMDIETYNQAKHLREKIQHIDVKIFQVEKIRKRDKDDDFNMCRELAHTSMLAMKEILEKDFTDL